MITRGREYCSLNPGKNGVALGRHWRDMPLPLAVGLFDGPPRNCNFPRNLILREGEKWSQVLSREGTCLPESMACSSDKLWDHPAGGSGAEPVMVVVSRDEDCSVATPTAFYLNLNPRRDLRRWVWGHGSLDLFIHSSPLYGHIESISFLYFSVLFVFLLGLSAGTKSWGSEGLSACVLLDMSWPCQGARPWTHGKLAKPPLFLMLTVCANMSGLTSVFKN